MSLVHRILVVEDEHVLAQNVRAYLARRSPDVRIAADGRCAIAMIASFTPDVVVLNYGLPGGENGLQIYSEMMRQRARPIGCVMTTGYPLEKISQPANKLGIHYLLCKPFSLAELQQLIDRSAEDASRAWNWPPAVTSGTGSNTIHDGCHGAGLGPL